MDSVDFRVLIRRRGPTNCLADSKLENADFAHFCLTITLQILKGEKWINELFERSKTQLPLFKSRYLEHPTHRSLSSQ